MLGRQKHGWHRLRSGEVGAGVSVHPSGGGCLLATCCAEVPQEEMGGIAQALPLKAAGKPPNSPKGKVGSETGLSSRG